MVSFNEVWTRLNSHRFFAVITYVAGAWSTCHYVLHNYEDFDTTHFTANKHSLKMYWLTQTFLQLLYLFQFWSSDSTVVDTAKNLTPAFTAFQVLETLWAFFLGKFDGKFHYFISLAIVVVNAANLIYYFHVKASYAIQPITRWWFIHVPVIAMPAVWVFYSFFWNGALALHWGSKHRIGGIFSNILIWVILLDAMYLLYKYRDWGIGFAYAFLTFAIYQTQGGHSGLNSFTLQEWFAAVISGILFVYSFLVAYPDISDNWITSHSSESGERAPLLGE